MSESDMEIARWEERRERLYQEWCAQNLVDWQDSESAELYERWYANEDYERTQIVDEQRTVLPDDDYY